MHTKYSKQKQSQQLRDAMSRKKVRPNCNWFTSSIAKADIEEFFSCMKSFVCTFSKDGKVASMPVISISASAVSFLDKQNAESMRTWNKQRTLNDNNNDNDNDNDNDNN